ncbi:hypothetical protein MVEN_00176600 [Mycena venus]|uniref:Uncharacterized protein n=1 Tax=Mycena venus TaxID=2733690 RepID=A0A8H7DDV6_9AGAR|nr:hypothetical protein MVEN_00176600 [Mycena venus]
MYYDYDNYSPDYYEPPEQYYDPEPVYYEPEPVYHDPQPVYEDDAFHDVQGDDSTWEADVYGDFGDGFTTDIPLYGEEIVEEEFSEEGEVVTDLEEHDQWDSDRYVLHNSLECCAEEDPAYAVESVDTPLGCDLAHATEAEVDGAAWECVFAQGPPADESPDAWYDTMDAWCLRIAASRDAEAPVSFEEDVDVREPPVHTSWVTAKLAELQDALQHGEIGPEQYAQEHADWLADELEDQRLQAAGYVWDEERADYWHPVHGWGADDDDDEPVDGLPPPSAFLETPDSALRTNQPSPLANELPLPSDVPAAPDLAADIEQLYPFPYIAPELYEPASLEPDVYEPCCSAHAPPAHVKAHPFAFTIPLRSVHRKPAPIRYTMPHTAYAPRNRLPPAKHPTLHLRGSRSSSAKPASKNRRSAGRRTRSCPDFQRGPPPHLETPPSPAAQEPGEPPDTPMTKAIQAAVARSATTNAPPPVEPVPPEIPSSSSFGTPLSLRSGPKPARSSREPPIAIVHAKALPVPPDIPCTHPSAALSAERRRNALRRLAK